MVSPLNSFNKLGFSFSDDVNVIDDESFLEIIPTYTLLTYNNAGEVISKELTQFIKDQTGGKVTVTAARFDNEYEVFIKNAFAKDVSITEKDIEPRGMTAFYQSMCRLIDDIGIELASMTDVRPSRVVIVVLTDGEENASNGIYAGEPGRQLLFDKINHQKDW